MRVTLNGYVVSDDIAWIYEYFGYCVISPGKVRQAIKDNPQGEDLTFEVNSPGGSVFAGFEIFSILKAAGIKTIAEVQSLAASAASTIVSGCTVVLMSPVAQIMLHLPSTITQGNENDHKDSINVLRSIKQSIINGYENKCKGKSTRSQLESMVNSTSWLNAQQAVDAGLADGILYQDDNAVLPENIVNAVGGGIRSLVNSGGGLPDVEQLRAQYKKLHPETPTQTEDNEPSIPAGNEPAENNDGWRAQAALDIEKIRF